MSHGVQFSKFFLFLFSLIGALADEAVSFGAISFLFGFVKQSVHSNPNLCQMALSALSVLVSSGMENKVLHRLKCEKYTRASLFVCLFREQLLTVM